MIKTMSSTEIPKWRSNLPRPVITVSHSMGSEEITEFVRIAVETGHLKEVLDGLPESYFASMKDVEDSPYEVIRTGDMFYSDPFKGTIGGESAEQRAIKNAKHCAQYKEGTYRVMKTVYIIESEVQEVRACKLFGEKKF